MTFGIFSVLFLVLAVVLLVYFIGKGLLQLLWLLGNFSELTHNWRMARRDRKYETRRWR